jgi:hypothetical protein
VINKNRVMVFVLSRLGLVLAAGIFCAGCGPGSVKLTSGDRQAFEQAAPDVKQTWERALAADKANDYLNAQTLLDSLEQMTLNEPQKQALQKQREAFNERVWKAAEKNDPAAVKAVQASRKPRNREQAPPTQ